MINKFLKVEIFLSLVIFKEKEGYKGLIENRFLDFVEIVVFIYGFCIQYVFDYCFIYFF